MSWWGEHCLWEMFTFLADHQKYFDGCTLYAHNGGKFDIVLLLRECLFKFERLRITGEKCVINNGRWIGFEVLFLEDEKKIYFRDSLAMIAGKLEKLLIDY